jgi:type III secretion protein L
MQKWLPDSFASDVSAPAAVLQKDDGIFEADHSGSGMCDNEKQRLFRSESGFSGPEAIMAHLTREERTQVFELVEQDISRDFEAREKELRANFEKEMVEAKNSFNSALDSWTENLHQALVSHLKETADCTARLAIQLAEKIVRAKVETDPEILLRALETTLFKIDGTKQIVVNVNPEQVQWLESRQDLLAKLGITQIVADRRVEAGGCIVKTHKQEWDATIKGQLAYMEELVEEMLTTADEPDLSGKGGSDEDPQLD